MGNSPSLPRRIRNNNKTHYYGEQGELINDNDVDRMQIQHHFAREVWGGNFSSPIKDLLNAGGATVLDVGCGPGTFICEMAADYPKAFYFGVDSFPTFPDLKPINVNFIRCNFLKGLPFKDNTFDFIHMRFLILELTELEWMKAVKELSRVLKPNGWIEMMEPRLVMKNEGPTTERIVNAIHIRARSHNINPYVVDRFKEFMESTNRLKNIQYQVKKLPCGKWKGDKMGELGAKFMYDIFKKHLPYVDDLMNIQITDHDVILNNFLQEIDIYCTYFEFYRCLGQKI